MRNPLKGIFGRKVDFEIKPEDMPSEPDIQVIQKDILSMTPQEFAAASREYLFKKIEAGEHPYRPNNANGSVSEENKKFLNNYETAWFSGSDMKFLSEKFGISETAFLAVNNRTHWNLILSADKNVFKTYDPISTRTRQQIRIFDTQDTKNISPYNLALTKDFEERYFKEADKKPKVIKNGLADPRFSQIDFLIEHKYKISDDFIDKLSAPQRDAYNCGPFCLYTAKMSNDGIVVIDDEDEIIVYD